MPFQPAKPKLLDQVRSELRKRHYSRRTEEAYISWIRRFLHFHRMRHPAQMARPEVEAVLSFLATDRNVAALTQNQALGALLFLYRDVLETGLDWLDGVVRAKKPKQLPVVLTRQEVQQILLRLRNGKWIAAKLLSGSGLRLLECLRLRVKDIDFAYRQITVREGKGGKDRVTVLPSVVEEPLKEQLAAVKIRHEMDLKTGGGYVIPTRRRNDIQSPPPPIHLNTNPQSSFKQRIQKINPSYSIDFPTGISMHLSTFFPLYYADSLAV